MGRHTVTGMLTAGGRQFNDWSADYRLFCCDRFDIDRLFDCPRQGVLELLPQNQPFVVALDDSLFRKTGRKIHGVSYRRDPLGPPFRPNFILGQRFLQISAALPASERPSEARMIPIDFRHCPTPKKPRHNAPEEDWVKYRKEKKETNITKKGAERLHALRSALNNDPGGKMRPLVASVDGSYTNGTVLKNLPEATVLIGRIRKDAKLYYLPRTETKTSRGRKPSYGERMPTPEQFRQDPSVPYQRINAWATGKMHSFKVKTIAPVRWRTAGQHHNLRLFVIAPLAYRLSKKSRILYRKPAYLICTDPDRSLQDVLQFYLWRWDIEVNFRDEKNILGAGEAQVRHQRSVENVPAFIIAGYAMLLLGARKAFGTYEQMPQVLPKPKWRSKEIKQRASTQELINHLRAELWGESIGMNNFSSFKDQILTETNPEKFRPNLASAVLYANA